MRYYKTIRDGYIISVGVGNCGIEIEESEYESILSMLNNKPEKAEGRKTMLTEQLEWEQVEDTNQYEAEISGEELLTMVEEVL